MGIPLNEVFAAILANVAATSPSTKSEPAWAQPEPALLGKNPEESGTKNPLQTEMILMRKQSKPHGYSFIGVRAGRDRRNAPHQECPFRKAQGLTYWGTFRLSLTV